MSITVKDALNLDYLRQLKLITGDSGLDREIERIGILDHEIVESITDSFAKGDFVITTFTAARDDIDLVKRCIKDLIQCEVAILAIKTIYYRELPKDIIEYANEHNFPIALFKEDVYFEFIIEDLLVGMKSRSSIELMESKIDLLFKKNMNKNTVRELAYELNSSLLDDFIVFYCKEKKHTKLENLYRTVRLFNHNTNKSAHHSLIKYREGLILILSFEKISDTQVEVEKNYIFNQLGIDFNQYLIGKSNYSDSLEQLDMRIKESIYAVEASEINHTDEMSFDDIGIYKILLPHLNDPWMIKFMQDTLNPIKSYDLKYKSDLLSTAMTYIETGGNIKETAEKLYQHKNTIRYRLLKIKELLGSAANDGEFYERLSLSIKLYLANKLYMG